MSAQRRTIDELAARYELEPSLRDVFVEGPFDSSVVEWVLRTNGCAAGAVYEIGTVEIPAGLLEKYSLPAGEKGRVIALCMELDSYLSPSTQVTGIVDRDYDTLLETSYSCPLLLISDYACMEMYFYDLDVVDKVLHFTTKGRARPAGEVLDLIKQVLCDTFLMRAANVSLGMGMTWLDLAGQCDVTRDSVTLDRATFAYKYLNRNAQLPNAGQFDERVASLRQRLTGDERNFMNGHDFVGLLGRYISKCVKNRSLGDPEVVERQLMQSADYARLSRENLFQQLLARVQS
jgi:hypothetical protein